jgi:hypothetical protein
MAYMTIVSSKEFVTDQDKYFDRAMNEPIFVQRGENVFSVTEINAEKQVYLEPDEDLHRAITIDELREKMHKRIHYLFANK